MDLYDFKSILKTDFPMNTISSMKTGGTVKYLFSPDSEEKFISLMEYLRENKIKYKVLGNISNVLIPDGYLDFCFVLTGKLSSYCLSKKNTIYASCGTPLTLISSFAGKNSLSGLEFAYGIPGSCGGGIFMNAGAYGGELSSHITKVRAFDKRKCELVSLDNSECDFSYRHSVFQENKNLIILGAYFELTPGNEDEIQKACEENMAKRKSSQPLEYPSCGSAFKRPKDNFAGKLIQDSGLSGFSVNDACVSEKHAGFIINKGNATSEDVIKLISHIKKKVYKDSGIMLENEIEILKL